MSPSSHEVLVIQNRLLEMSRVERWLAGFIEKWEIPAGAGFAVDLVINEAVANVISHAYRDGADHQIAVSLTDTPEAVVVEIVDDGEAFNPFDAPAMATASDLEQAAIGGRGIHLIKSYSDDYDYRRVAGRNRLRLAIRKERGG